MPTGKVKFFDADKGFGFITAEDHESVFLPSSALPAGTTTLRPGTRVEFDVADGRKGPQALFVRVLESAPSIAKAKRTPADDMASRVEDLINVLDQASNQLRRGRYPDSTRSGQIAKLLRAVADDFEA